MKTDRQGHSENDNNNTQNEPKVENDYKNVTEIEVPNPSTASPSIPAEMPPR
jgi:hypothetical protein